MCPPESIVFEFFMKDLYDRQFPSFESGPLTDFFILILPVPLDNTQNP